MLHYTPTTNIMCGKGTKIPIADVLSRDCNRSNSEEKEDETLETPPYFDVEVREFLDSFF